MVNPRKISTGVLELFGGSTPVKQLSLLSPLTILVFALSQTTTNCRTKNERLKNYINPITKLISFFSRYPECT
jgi:hypothetical protein